MSQFVHGDFNKEPFPVATDLKGLELFSDGTSKYCENKQITEIHKQANMDLHFKSFRTTKITNL
jgi:hypothetical protein